MKKVIPCLLLSFALLFAGCGSQPENGEAVAGYQPVQEIACVSYVNIFNFLPTSYGCYYTLKDDGHGKAMFYDYTSKKQAPVCSRPNCSHNVDKDEDCDAYRWSGILCENNGTLYMLSAEGPNHTIVYTMGKDFSNKKELFSADEELSSIGFSGDSMFFVADKTSLSASNQVEIERSVVVQYNLKTGENRNLQGTNEKLYKRLIEIHGTKVCYCEIEEYDFNPLAVTNETVIGKITVYVQDFAEKSPGESREQVVSLDVVYGAVDLFYDGRLYYRTGISSPLYSYEIASGKTETVWEEGDEWNAVFIADHKIFYITQSEDGNCVYHYYDLLDKSHHDLAISENPGMIFDVISERKDYLILQSSMQEGSIYSGKYLVLPKEKLYEKNVLDSQENYDVIYEWTSDNS